MALTGCSRDAAAMEELRGLWVDTFHPVLRNDADVRQLVADARSGGFNALFVEVRRRGDAFYESRFEPRADEVVPGFDPLRLLLELAHDPMGGARLEVHAWMVAFNIWNSRTTTPSSPDHPYRRHPEWLTRDRAGRTWDGANYAFDPGHPGVQTHTFNVAMDLIRRYELDGLHWDYVRYAGRDWGYNDVAVARFNARHGRTGRPAAADPAWLQFRRDQVTGLMRKVWLTAFAEKPALRISAATITFAPGLAATAQWPTSAAYSEVLQDWRAWLEEGILDLSIPMAYFRQNEHAAALEAWNVFIKDHQYQRHAALGLGFYLNTTANSLAQIRQARQPAPNGRRAVGIVGFSYAAPALDASRADFLRALTQPSALDPQGPPVFAESAVPPGLPWKTHSPNGHTLGYVRHAGTEVGLDGAEVTVCGPAPRVLTTDATGCYGAVDLPPGDYSAMVAVPGFEPASADFTVRPARVARLEFGLTPTSQELPATGSSGEASGPDPGRP